MDRRNRIGVANGVAREAIFAKRCDERTADQLSTLTAIVGFAGYFGLLQRRWPLAGTREALKLGGAWLALPIAYQFALGRLVARQPWPELVADYILAKRRTWPLVLAWIAVARCDGKIASFSPPQQSPSAASSPSLT